jgi:hypothetical protein
MDYFAWAKNRYSALPRDAKLTKAAGGAFDGWYMEWGATIGAWMVKPPRASVIARANPADLSIIASWDEYPWR